MALVCLLSRLRALRSRIMTTSRLSIRTRASAIVRCVGFWGVGGRGCKGKGLVELRMITTLN